MSKKMIRIRINNKIINILRIEIKKIYSIKPKNLPDIPIFET